jgi:hypothetical protein
MDHISESPDGPWPIHSMFNLSSMDKRHNGFSVWDGKRTSTKQARVFRPRLALAFSFVVKELMALGREHTLTLPAERTPITDGREGGCGHCDIRNMPHSGKKQGLKPGQIGHFKRIACKTLLQPYDDCSEI